MLSSRGDIEHLTQQLIELCGEEYPWRWEEEKQLLLSEFASNKQEKIFTLLSEYFEHQWHTSNVRNLPEQIKIELGDLASLKGEQIIFTSSTEYKHPTNIIAFWWPWGHGGTISLRLSVLEGAYQGHDIKTPPAGCLNWFKQLFL